jgi:hypothetical protein
MTIPNIFLREMHHEGITQLETLYKMHLLVCPIAKSQSITVDVHFASKVDDIMQVSRCLIE